MMSTEIFTISNVDIEVIYSLSAISFGCTVVMVLTLTQYGMRSISSWLLFYLTFFLMLDLIASLPVYAASRSACVIMAFMKAYADFMNILMSLAITTTTYSFIFYANTSRRRFILSGRYHFVILISPLITLLPFTTNSYGQEFGTPFCFFIHDNYFSNIWFCVYLATLMVLVVFNVAVFVSILLKLDLPSDWPTAKKIFLGDGVYALITILCWIPKFLQLSVVGNGSLSRFSAEAVYFAHLCTCVQGILYSVAFLFSKKSIRDFELFMKDDIRLSSLVTSDEPGSDRDTITSRDSSFFNIRASAISTGRTSLVVRPLGEASTSSADPHWETQNDNI